MADFILDDATKAYLDELQIGVLTSTVQSNVRGDIQIVPRPGAAEALFESYTAAMQYNARPICTLDEYVAFLGPDGLTEELISPSEPSALYSNKQVHPAWFYVRIRRFREGPPQDRPRTNITNSLSVTDAPAGTTATAPMSSGTSYTNLREYLDHEAPVLIDNIFNRLNTIIATFNNTNAAGVSQVAGGTGLRAVADTFLALQAGTAGGGPEALAPVTALSESLTRIFTGAPTLNNLQTLYSQLENSGLYLPDELNRIALGIDRAAHGLAGAEATPPAQAAQAPANAPQTGTGQGTPPDQASTTTADGVTGTERTTGTGAQARQYTTYPVDGRPLNFPETRANWDVLLEQYRYNVLTRKAPLP